MRSFRGFSFNKKKKNEDDDSKYNRYGRTATFGRKNSTYFPVSQEEVGRKKRRMVVNLLLSMTCVDNDIQTSLLWDVSQGFDLPLVIGEQFICKIGGKKFQSASYNDCLQFILTTLYDEGHEFAKSIYDKLMSRTDLLQKCELAYHGFDVQTRTYHFHEYEKCFVGKEAVTWMIENRLCKKREDAVLLAKEWKKRGYIRHVENQQEFEDQKYFYSFNDKQCLIAFNNLGKNSMIHNKAMSMMIDHADVKEFHSKDNNDHHKSTAMNRYNTSEYSEFGYPGSNGYNHPYNYNQSGYNGSPPRHIKDTPSYSSRNRNLSGDSKFVMDTGSPRKKGSFTLPTIFGSH